MLRKYSMNAAATPTSKSRHTIHRTHSHVADVVRREGGFFTRQFRGIARRTAAYALTAVALVGCDLHEIVEPREPTIRQVAAARMQTAVDPSQAFPMFPDSVSENTTRFDRALFARAPDDQYEGIGVDHVTYDFGSFRVIDRPGVDINVYELDTFGPEFNVIEVLVSVDGVTFTSIKATETALVRIPGDGAHGNDRFGRSYDLAGSGLAEVRFVKVQGTGTNGTEGPNRVGFDLDAIGAHAVMYPEAVRISRAELDFGVRSQARGAEEARIRVATHALLQRRQALEAQIRDVSAVAERARQDAVSLDADRARIEADKQTLLAFMEKIRSASRHEVERAREFLQQIANLREDIVRLELEIAALQAQKKPTENKQNKLRGQITALNAAELLLYEQFRDDTYGRELLRRLDNLQNEMLTLRRLEQEALAQLRTANDALCAAVAEHVDVDALLSQLAGELADLDASIRSITVQAADATVFRAVTRVSFDEVSALNQRIAESARNRAALEEEKTTAFLRYLETRSVANTLHKRFEYLIMPVALGKAVTEGGFLYVELRSAASKGGLAAVLGEGFKSWMAQQIEEAMETPDVDPVSVEAEMQRKYSGYLDGSWNETSLEKFALETGIGQLLNIPKEASKFPQWGLDRLGWKGAFTWLAERDVAKSTYDSDRFSRAAAHLRRLRGQADHMREAFRVDLKDLGNDILKDAVKEAVTGWLDRYLKDALLEAIGKDMEASAYYSLWQTAAEYYWNAYDKHEELLAQKAALLDGLDGESGLETVVSVPFARNEKLRVTIDVASGNPAAYPFDVLIGGMTATRVVPSTVFEITVQNPVFAPDGTLWLKVR